MKSIIIVGSGAAGTVLSRQLLASGGDYQITMFEAGPELKPGDRRLWLDTLTGRNIYEKYFDDPSAEHREFGRVGGRLFVKGGTTNHWGGLTPRFKPEDFELKSRTGRGADWPISYKDLAPYYATAETLLGVTGDSSSDDPPRYGAKFPFQAPDYTRDDDFLIDILDKHEISYGHAAIVRNGDRCITTGTCDYCPVNAKYTALYDLVLLQGEYPGKLTVKTDSPVTKVRMDSKKRCRGVDFTDLKTGSRHTMDADLVILCNGTFESTKLLLASANREWPDGIGNHSDHLGRHLIGHPVMFAGGVRPNNPDMLYRELGFSSLLSRYFDSPEYQHKGKMWFRPTLGATSSIEQDILSGLSRGEMDAKMSAEMSLSFGGEMEQFETPQNRISLASGTTKLGLPKVKIEFGDDGISKKTQNEYVETFSKMLVDAGCKENSIQTGAMNPDGAHASGTCRMSRSAADGVVDLNLRIHDTDNLYVCSNAVFPSIAAANPTLTMSALAVRLAEHINNHA